MNSDDADDALIAHARGFRRRAGLQDIVQRHDGGGGKVCMLQLSTGLVEHFAERQDDQFQVLGKALELRGWQEGEQMILTVLVE